MILVFNHCSKNYADESKDKKSIADRLIKT